MAWDINDPAQLLADELTLRAESGYDLSMAEHQVREALEQGDLPSIARADLGLEHTKRRDDWSYIEPSELAEIELSRMPTPAPACSLDDHTLRDRLLAAWLGRCAGCNLGKPVEGWSRARIRTYLERVGAYPIDDYIPALDDMSGDLRLNDCWPETTRGNVAFMARDDDIDYTILALHLLEDRGFDIGPADVAAEWLDHLPYTQVYTAERLAYRNLVAGLHPPGPPRSAIPIENGSGRRSEPISTGTSSRGIPPQRRRWRSRTRPSRTRRTASTARCGWPR